jgi:predicted  nucleic acid-binding Zn-ribbon protein
MELDILIHKLTDERAKLDAVIASLEELRKAVAETEKKLGKKRGRKFMDEQGRKEVSERMKKYWAARRSARVDTAGVLG